MDFRNSNHLHPHWAYSFILQHATWELLLAGYVFVFVLLFTFVTSANFLLAYYMVYVYMSGWVLDSISLGTSQATLSVRACLPPPHWCQSLMPSPVSALVVLSVQSWALECVLAHSQRLLGGALRSRLSGPRGLARSGIAGCRQSLQACHCSPLWLLRHYCWFPWCVVLFCLFSFFSSRWSIGFSVFSLCPSPPLFFFSSPFL